MLFDPTPIFRRSFLTHSVYGLGSLALASVGGFARASEKGHGAVFPLHHPPKAKRVIHLCMAGGPSQFETLDYKPRLKELNGKEFPESFTKGQQLAQLQNTRLVARGPSFPFKKWGESGQEICEAFPAIGGIADDIAIVRSMQTEQINHDPAHAFLNSGSILKGRPSMGSWLLYGLGTETDSLPGYVVITSAGRTGQQPVSARQWSAGFLPSKFQGVQFQAKGDAVHFVGNPPGVDAAGQKSVIDEVNKLNALRAAETLDPEALTRIAQYELAFKMQSSVPDLTDFSKETKETLALYGIKQPGDGSFASNCLMARRLVERGVRFVQLYHRAWDHHGELDKGIKWASEDCDKPCAALIRDLKRLGMLDDTLVIWGGEFGRTPMGQGSGRDHHILSFSLWMAGGGVKGGVTYGATDELGYRSVENVVQIRDLHATILYLCGIDHAKLSVKYQGLDMRLTGVEPARVVKEVLV
jgi:hypothetical protein